MTSYVDLTKTDNAEEIVYIVVDELDDNPKLYRKKNDKTFQQCLYICDNVTCNRTGANMARCTGCFYNRYCSSFCQKQDWSHHKGICEKTCVGCQKIVKDFEVIKQVDFKGELLFVKYCSKQCEQSDNRF